MPSPQVSVVVPSRGGAARLPILLDALAEQTFDGDWEVVVVLDGDMDDSRSVVDRYRDRLPLRVLTRTAPHGVAAALADGYAAARGTVVIRCDDDLSPRPDFVARHMAWHRGRPADSAPVGVIALTRDIFDQTHYAEAYGRPANELLLGAAYARPADHRWMHWAACNSVSKSAYENVGGFDVTMAYREDSELGLRLARSGVEIVIDPLLEIEHRCPAPDAESRVTRAFTSGASTRAFADRHPDLRDRPFAPSRPTVWNRAVSAQARMVRSRKDAARLGRWVDVLLPLTPHPLREKLVAWAVESSAQAGTRVGDVDWFRPQGVQDTRPIAETPEVAIFVPGLSAAGGAEKTALRLAMALRDMRLHVTCFTDTPVQRASLSAHFGMDLSSIDFSVLPGEVVMPSFVPRAIRDVVRDRRHVRAISGTRPTLYINLKYKSSLPGLGRRNWYYVHFPHPLELPRTTVLRTAYQGAIRQLRRAVIHPGSRSFLDDYELITANSHFTASHVKDRWQRTPPVLHPPCDLPAAAMASHRERIILSVGRFQSPGLHIPHKNQHILVDAFKQLPDLIASGWTLHLVGALSDLPADRAYFERLLELTQDWPVTVAPNASHEDLSDLCGRSSLYWHAQGFGTDASLYPEAQEHFGISTVEAMGFGLVPIVYATAGPWEIVSPVDPSLGWTTVPELLHRTRALAAEPSLEHLRDRCRERAEAFSPSSFNGQVAQMWSGLSTGARNDRSTPSGGTHCA